MFKNIQFFKISPEFHLDTEVLATALVSNHFLPCGLSQEESFGWVEPRDEKHGALVEPIGGHLILKFMYECKIVPKSVLAEAVEKRVVEITETTGRKPGKKETKEISEDIHNDLLAKAFTKKTATYVWLNPVANMLVIGTGTQTRAGVIITNLVNLLPGFAVSEFHTKLSAQNEMTTWLMDQQLPNGFTADRDCQLKAQDQSNASVKYAKHPLDIVEIQEHLKNGKVPVQLAISWCDRVSFALTEKGLIKKIEFLKAKEDKSESGFDANVAIATGELTKLIPAVIEILGGDSDVPAA